jgi:hypothetical protein
MALAADRAFSDRVFRLDLDLLTGRKQAARKLRIKAGARHVLEPVAVLFVTCNFHRAPI